MVSQDSSSSLSEVERWVEQLRARARPPVERVKKNDSAVWLSRCQDRNVPGHYAVREAIKTGPRDTLAVRSVRGTVEAFMAVRADRNSVGSVPAMMMLCGPPRTGKTVALSYAVASVDTTALYVTTYQIADIPKPSRHFDDHPYQKWRQVDVLAIDELHADESVIPRVKSLLYERWDNGKCTLLGGNVTVPVFMERYLCDPALERRVMEEYGQGGKLSHLDFAVTVKEL